MASKTLQSTIEIAGVLSPSLQAAINNAVSKLEEISQETLDAAGASEKLCVEMDAQESVLKALQRGYADYVLSGQESSDEAQALADKIQQLSEELGDNREAMQNAEKAAKALGNKVNSMADEVGEGEEKLQELGDEAEEAGQKAENSSEGYTILKNVIANLATEAIEKAVEAFKELAFEGDSALAKLKAKTGATSEEMQGFEDVLYEVYNANYGDSLGGVSDALSTVIQLTDDLDNASLAQITKNAIALEDVFGYDVTESMRAVNSLMDQFGVTSEQAFNLIVQGAQKGLDQNGDLLDTINEYSVQFKTAGYSADDMFNMLANGAEFGTWSVDKLGDAVKEFNIRASDGTVSEAIKKNAKAFGLTKKEAEELSSQIEGGSVEAYQKLLDKLKEVDDDATRYQMGVAMYGTMWEDLGEDAVFALMETEGAINSTADAMAKMDAAAYDTLESSLSQLGRTIKAEVVQPIAEKLIPVVKKAVEYITANVGPAVDWLLDHLPEVGIVLGTVGSVIAAMKWGSIVSQITKVVGAVKGFGAALAGISAPVWAVIAVVAVLAAAFVNLWRNNEEFRDKMTEIWEGIKGKFEAFGQAITDKLNALGFNFESFSEVVGAIWNGFCNLLAPVFEGAFQQVSNVLSFALDTLSGLFDVFSGIFTGDWTLAWQGCQEIATSIWNFMVSSFRNYLETIKNVADTVLGWFGSSWSEVWNSVSSFFVKVWKKIASFFSDTLDKIEKAASNAWNAISSTTSSMWESIRSTISSKISSAKDAVSTALSGISSTMSSTLSTAVSTVTSKFSSIYDTIKSKMDNAKTIVSNAVSALKDAFNFSWKLPELKLPHISVTGGVAPYGIGGKGSLPKFSIEWYKDGGILNGAQIFGAMGSNLLGGGEAGPEAVLPLSTLWDKMDAILRRILDDENTAGGTSDAGLTSKAGELLTLDNFSLGSLADGTSVVIYYDFSNFTWSPQIQGGTGDNADDFMAKLRAHEAEFFDWLEEFVQMREVAQYA